jgi:hypothetical protein
VPTSREANFSARIGRCGGYYAGAAGVSDFRRLRVRAFKKFYCTYGGTNKGVYALLFAVGLFGIHPSVRSNSAEMDSRAAWCSFELQSMAKRFGEVDSLANPVSPDIDSFIKEQRRAIYYAQRRIMRYLELRKVVTNLSDSFMVSLTLARQQHYDDTERFSSCSQRMRCIDKALEATGSAPSEGGNDRDVAGSSKSGGNQRFEDRIDSCLAQCGSDVLAIKKRKSSCLDPSWLPL